MTQKLLIVFLISLFLFSLPFSIKAAIEFKNPLKYDTIEDLISAIINWLYTIALVIVPGVIVLAGYFFIASGGNPQKVATAKNMVLYALIGLLIIILSSGIIDLIRDIVGVK